MDEKLKIFDKTIKKRHSFGLTPKYKEEFKTSLNETVFVPIVEEIMKQLNWEIVYLDDNSIQAICKSESIFGFDNFTEKIKVSYKHGKILAKSESTGNEIWDNGKNYKRVQLFIYVFKELEENYDKETLQSLEKEQIRRSNWDDYQIPHSLPKPHLPKKPNFIPVLIGGFIVAMFLGFILATISHRFTYIIILFEFLIATAISFSLIKLIKFSNYINYKKTEYLLIGIVIIIYFFNFYFQYEIILYEKDLNRIGFYEFTKFRLQAGLTFDSFKTGWIGLVISWIIQLVVTYYLAMMLLTSSIIKYQINRVPMQVIDFAFYHFVKGKSEKEVRQELALKGWENKQNQDEIMEAIGAIQGAKEMNREVN